MGYICLVLLGIVACFLLANLPSVFCAAIGWLKYKNYLSAIIYFLFPYIFIIVFSLLLTVGGAIVYNMVGLDFFGGDVRQMPLKNTGVEINMMDYDMDNATLAYDSIYTDFQVDGLAFRDDTIYFHKSNQETAFDIENYDIVSDTLQYGKLLPSKVIVWLEPDDKELMNLDWHGTKEVYDEEENQLTGIGMIIVSILSIFLAILTCVGIKRATIKKY